MSSEKPVFVVAIGGNAIETEGNELRHSINAIAMLRRRGSVAVTHGNGPQVGELADLENAKLSLLTAQTEGSIGMVLKRSMAARRISSEVVLTTVAVDARSGAAREYTKPIGRFYKKSEVRRYESRGIKFSKLIGGYRRVVRSPLPERITNIEVIRSMVKKYVVICGGGGGIPIIERRGKMEFVDAVIDKDYTSSLLAVSLGAKSLFILTNVDGAYLHFKKKNQELLRRISVMEAEKYLNEGGFEEGSMKPKVDACVEFVRKTRGTAVIGNLNKAELVAKLKSGTLITP